jgi:hypothetical protein
MEKESISIDIGTNNKIESEVDNIQDDEGGDLPCGGDKVFVEVKPKAGISKTICYKCKTNKSNYLNRNEFICR